MAVHQIDETKPYTAYNGHLMCAPIFISDRDGAVPFQISAEAYCVDNCRACGEGDRPEYFAGEEYDPDGGAYDWAW